MSLHNIWKSVCRAAVALGLAATTVSAVDPASLVYVGTYTGAKSKGIYAYRMDLAKGTFEDLGLVAETPNPSFLALDPKGHFLYAANELEKYGGAAAGSVTSFAIDSATGKLKQLNQESSRGTDPCHLIVDPSGHHVLVANYGSGSLASLPVRPDGSLGPAVGFVQNEGKGTDPARQTGPHAHCLTMDPSNLYVLGCDLGLDKVLIWHFDSVKGTLVPNQPAFAAVKPGSGPRHMAFGHNGRFLYVLNEMTATVSAFHYDPLKGALKELETVAALPAGHQGSFSGAEIAVHPNGRFLYASIRGANTIAIFEIQPMRGTLSLAGHMPTGGRTPRNFAIDPTGHFLLAANQDTDTIVEYAIHQDNGTLTPAGHILRVPSPVCVTFLPLHP